MAVPSDSESIRKRCHTVTRPQRNIENAVANFVASAKEGIRDMGDMCRRRRRFAAGFVAALLIGALVSASASASTCPNEGARTGASEKLPDCRAYELVTPPNSDGSQFWGISSFGEEILFNLFPTELASPSQDNVVYVAYTSPLVNPSKPNGNFDLYEAKRGPSRWETIRHLTPSGAQAVIPRLGGVSSDHQYSFTWVNTIDAGARPAGSLAGENGTNYLSRPDGSFELVGKGSLGEEPLAQGRYISAGGEHVIFSTGHLGGQ